MKTVTPVTIQTPDGVERELRFTLGARKRIVEIFGMPMQASLNKFGEGALPGILFALMHDAAGKPPRDITLESLAETLPAGSSTELLAAIMSAGSQGEIPKNEFEALLTRLQQETPTPATTSTSGPSVLKPLESQPETSGTDSLNVNSSPESKPIEDKSAAGI